MSFGPRVSSEGLSVDGQAPLRRLAPSRLVARQHLLRYVRARGMPPTELSAKVLEALKAICVSCEGRLPGQEPGAACVDLFLFLRIMLHSFKEEQARSPSRVMGAHCSRRDRSLAKSEP